MSKPVGNPETIEDVIHILENAERISAKDGLRGGETDTPEGSRYILISDTLLTIMSQTLRREIQDQKDQALDRCYEKNTRD